MKQAFNLVLALVLLPCPQALAVTLKVAAAISTQDALDEIAAKFKRETGHQVMVTYGGSGKFYAQLSQGAPFDLFFSADNEFPAKLYRQGLAEAPRHYGRGKLVLWTLKESSLDPQKGLEVLKDNRIRRVAIANPDLAPYGRAALEVLQASKLYGSVQHKLVRGENIAQAAQFADSGSADIGFLSLSLTRSPRLRDRGKGWLIPGHLYNPLDQDAAVITGSGEKAVARQFLAYCTAPTTREIWKRYGYEVE